MSPSPSRPVVPPFDRFLAIDWSGARGPGYRGVAVAQADAGDSPPVLVPAPGAGRWTRQAVLDLLLAGPSGADRRWLVALDFAFSLPHPQGGAPQQWARIDTLCAADADLLGQRYIAADPRFWASGPQPSDWPSRARATERACAQAGLGHPQSPLKLIGARQVGKGSLAGQRLLHRLRTGRCDVCIWPFDGLPQAHHRLVVVELYPRLFIRMAGLGNAKLRTCEQLNRALAALGSAPLPGSDTLDDHATDALIGAAGLRRLSGDPGSFTPGADSGGGWIFGVPADLAR